MHLAIVGAGMAGLAAAHQLRQQRPDISITMYEKSRGVGGRVATRRFNGATFDHGAQYIKAPTPALEALLHALPRDTLVDITRPVWTFNGAGTLAAGDPAQHEAHKWTYRDGITRLAKELAQGLDIRFETRISRLSSTNAGYELFDEHGTSLPHADAVLLTAPAPQLCTLLEASELFRSDRDLLRAELDKASYRPCLTLTLGYPPRLRDRPFYALVNTDKHHPISWLAYEHFKPGRDMGNQHVLIAQMAPGWSSAHWDDPLESVTAQVTHLVQTLLDEDLPQPQWSNRQGWRYALPDGCADFETLNTRVPGLFFAGDFTAGQGRVHRALEEGWRAGDRIANSVYKPAK